AAPHPHVYLHDVRHPYYERHPRLVTHLLATHHAEELRGGEPDELWRQAPLWAQPFAPPVLLLLFCEASSASSFLPFCCVFLFSARLSWVCPHRFPRWLPRYCYP